MTHTRSRVIVAIGDSTTAGTPGFLSPREAPPAGRGDVTSQYAYWLMHAHPEWTVLNQGIDGQRSDEIRSRFDEDVVAVQPEVVIVIAGVNDVYQGRGADCVQRELAAMYDRARAAGIGVVAATIIPYDTATDDQNACMRAINAWIEQQTRRNPWIAFADTRAAVASPSDPDRLRSSPDGLHPDADGYRRMAAALEPAIIRAAGAQ
jgi:acyl-CoA thioesterase-1